MNDINSPALKNRSGARSGTSPIGLGIPILCWNSQIIVTRQ